MILPELRWAWYCAVSRDHNCITRQQAIRRLLRKAPTWLHGHILLGEYALAAYEVDQRDSVQRHLATVRVSVKAIRMLADQAESSEAAGPLIIARFFEAMLAFHTKQFEDALVEFEQMLRKKELQQLPKEYLARGVESAAAAALAVEDRERAKQLFSLLPPELSSSLSETALNFISNSEEKGSDVG